MLQIRIRILTVSDIYRNLGPTGAAAATTPPSAWLRRGVTTPHVRGGATGSTA
jgi:hypothetical protein